MGRHPGRILASAVALILAALAGAAIANGRAPAVSNVTLAPVWGDVYKLSAVIHANGSQINAAEYRVGGEIGTLFPTDGEFDGRDESVETYIELKPGEAVAVRAEAGGDWSDWAEAPAAAEGAGGTSGCDLQSDARGDGDWFRGPVTVDCTALMTAEGAEGIQYSLSYGDWIDSGATFPVDAEGVTWVQVRPVSSDGTAGLPETFTVSIDQTPPRVSMQAQPDPQLSHADQLFLDFTAEDGLSGVALAVADIDAEQEIQAGSPLDLWELPLGEHSITVLAKDQAGNTAQLDDRIQVEVSTDTATIAKLVQIFSAKGRLDGYSGLKQKLLSQLGKAGDLQAAGDLSGARMQLELFVEQVRQGAADGLIWSDAADVLIGDATWTQDHLADDTGVTPPDWSQN